MAFTEFYVQTTGDNTNAGSTTSDSPAYSATNGGWDSGTGVFTPTSGNPSLSVAVGDFASVYNDGATLAVFIGRVTAVSSTTITISTTVKSGTAPTTSGTARTIKVGGAWKGPNAAVIFPFNFLANTTRNTNDYLPRVNMKAGTNYAVTATITANQAQIIYQGYTTAPGDGGRAIIDFTGATTGGMNNTGAGCIFADIVVQNNTVTANSFILATRSLAYRCVVRSVRQLGFNLGAGAMAVECEVYDWNKNGNASTQAFTYASGCILVRCYAHDPSTAAGGTTRMIAAGTGPFDLDLIGCIAANINGEGYVFSTGSVRVLNCDAYNCGGSGFVSNNNASNQVLYFENCNAFKCNGYGFDCNSGTATRTVTNMLLVNCASGTGLMANASGRHNDFNIMDIDPIFYPAGLHPWADVRAGDYRLVNVLAKGKGRGRFTQIQQLTALTRGYPDVGAATFWDRKNLNFDSPGSGIY